MEGTDARLALIRADKKGRGKIGRVDSVGGWPKAKSGECRQQAISLKIKELNACHKGAAGVVSQFWGWQAECSTICQMETNVERPSGKRILLVEDECSVRDTLRELLRYDDHTVIEANNGAEALSLFAKDQFDLVLTDCVMPFIRGTELAARIKHMAPNQPILMITGYDLRPGRMNPVDLVLQKPFDLEGLRSALKTVLQTISKPQVLQPC